MSSFPLSAARVPNLLQSRLMLSAITRGNIDLARLQTQLATNRAINAPSDDAVKASAVGVLNDRLERWSQLTRNLQHAQTALNENDQALSDASDTFLEAKQIASSQINLTAGAEERASQAVIVDSLIDTLLSIANRSSIAGYVFGGNAPTVPPIQSFQGGFRYVASGGGLLTDLGVEAQVPLTLGAGGLGSTSARLVGLADLAPELHAESRIAELRGGRGVGISLGTLELAIGASEPFEIDLSSADTVQDVADTIIAAIRGYESENSTTVLDSGVISFSGGAFSIDIVAGGPTLTFTESGAGTTARDLGLAADDGSLAFDETTSGGIDLAPRLTLTTPLSSIPSLSLPLGEIVIRNNGRSAQIDLSAAETIQDIRSAIESANLGIRVTLDQDDNRLIVVNEVANSRNLAMSIEEVAGNNATASQLGIRSFDLGTRIADFNDGRGVEVLSGATDPITGLPDPAHDVDFTITLGDGAELDINLDPSDLTTVESLIDAINSQLATGLAALGRPTTDLVAGLSNAAGGIMLVQDSAITGAVSITARNGSPAAEQLGLLTGAWNPSSATFAGEDRAKVRVLNAFTSLIDLRDSLLANETRGITLAGESLESVIDSNARTRALVGGYAQRIDHELTHVEDRAVYDESARSQLQDLDFAAAASRFTLLQTQLQAGYQAASQIGRLSLLDFLR